MGKWRLANKAVSPDRRGRAVLIDIRLMKYPDF